MKILFIILLIIGSGFAKAETTVINKVTSTSSSGGNSSSTVNGKTYNCKGSLSVVNEEATCNGKKIAPTIEKGSAKPAK